MVNLYRFLGLPNALKPVILGILILVMVITGSSHIQEGKSASGAWFFWLTAILQFVFMSSVFVLFLFEMETLATCGRDAWPVVEMVYSGVFGIIDILNMFIVANWNKIGSAGFIIAAMLIFALVILYALGGIMMFRMWKGNVTSGAAQNPTGNVQPGNIGNMHPGV